MLTRDQQLEAAADPALFEMKQRGLAMTRENYIMVAYGVPEREWTIEDEVELPEQFRDYERFPQLRP